MTTPKAPAMHTVYQTEAEWVAEIAAVKARRAAVEAQTARDWAHINALIARAATEEALSAR